MENKNIQENSENSIENLYRMYDGLVGLTLWKILDMSKKNKIICLFDFDRKNLEHLYVLQVALIARSIYNFDIKIKTNFWNLFLINRKIKKGFGKVKKAEASCIVGIQISTLLDSVRSIGKKFCDENFTFADIYNAYYKED